METGLDPLIAQIGADLVQVSMPVLRSYIQLEVVNELLTIARTLPMSLL